MDAKDSITFTMDHGLKVLMTYLSDISDEEMMTRPAPGANHLKWQIGHLIGAEAYFLNAVAPGTGILLPEGHAEKHGKENTASDDAADFMTKDEYLDLFQRQRDATKAALANYPADKLDDPAPEGLRERFPTVGDVFLLMGDHVMMHAGQFAIAPRAE